MRRHLFNFCAALSLLLFLAVCVFWVRSINGYDHAALTYDRYLPDRSAASDQVHVISDNRLWLNINSGNSGPRDVNLARGYYTNADASGGRPRFRFSRGRYDPTWSFPTDFADTGTTGWGPIRWQSASRSRLKDGDDFLYFRIGISHWLAAPGLIVLPMLWFHRFRKERRARTAGLCRKCHYDLRATPQRCPECGTLVIRSLSSG